MLFCSNFYPIPFFFIFINFEYHVRTRENLIKLSLQLNFYLLCGDAYIVTQLTVLRLLKHAEKWTQYVLITCIFPFDQAISFVQPPVLMLYRLS